MLGLSGAVGLSAAKHERPQMDKVRGSGCVSWFRLNYRFLSVLLALSTALSAFLPFPCRPSPFTLGPRNGRAIAAGRASLYWSRTPCSSFAAVAASPSGLLEG